QLLTDPGLADSAATASLHASTHPAPWPLVGTADFHVSCHRRCACFWTAKHATHLLRRCASRARSRDRNAASSLPLEVFNRASHDRRHHSHCRACDATAAQYPGKDCCTANHVRQNPAQSPAIAWRNNRHRGRSHHGLGFALMHFVRSCLRHHFRHRFVVCKRMRGDFMRHFLLAFSLGLAFKFIFEFALTESFARQISEGRPERTSDRGTHHWRGNLRDLLQERSGLFEKAADLAEELLAFVFTFESALVF